jgi:propanol-preferring alcohol dehydrogenase
MAAVTARAMILDRPRTALRHGTLAPLERRPGQILVRVTACGVCRTDLHVIDGDLPRPKLPIVPGHEIVGRVAACDADGRFREGDRVGVAWLGATCGRCDFCRRGEENLCPDARFTGYDLDGGYAEMILADERFAFALPGQENDATLAPLLCAGLIGYRALRKCGDARRLGVYGFGAAAHLVAQVAVHEGRQVFAFTRPDDDKAQVFARSLGATWAGASDRPPPEALDAAIIFAPVGSLVPAALAAVRPAGRVVCAGIHMSDIPSFRYALLWRERQLVSVANLTRRDGKEFLALAARIGLRPTIESYPLVEANRALADLRSGNLTGAAVLVPEASA